MKISLKIIKYIILLLISLQLMNNSLYAHDPQVAYAIFKLFGISLLLIVLLSFIFSIIFCLIIVKLNKANEYKKRSLSMFISLFLFGISIGIFGLIIDYKLASATDFYGNSSIIFFWLIGVFVGEIFGFIFENNINHKN